MTADPVIDLRDVTVEYGRHPAVHHVSGSFARGSLTAVVGPNGAGKSTLMRAITGELALSQGRIARSDLTRRDIGYLPQAAEIQRDFPIQVFDLVALGLWHETGAFGGLNRRQRARVGAAIANVGLAGMELRPIGTLSAGQFQRALFARLLLQDAAVILLDEPFTAVDQRTTEDLLAMIGYWHGEGRTVIAVLHDLDQVRRHFPQTLLIARELIHWGPTDGCLTPALLDRARAMAQAFDDTAPVCQPERRMFEGAAR